jgi:hypothetical protein
MMENVASFVPLGEGVQPILTSSRVTEYSWDELATAPAYDRIELTPTIAAAPDSTGDTGVEHSPAAVPFPATGTPMEAIDPEIEGLWETGRLTRETMAATLEAAGLDPSGAEVIAENEGFDEYVVYQVEISDGRWTILVFPDGEPAGVGWAGNYEILESGTVTAIDDLTDCTLIYEYDVSGDQLSVDLINDPCGDEDVPFQTVIFESTPFTRVE